MSCSTLGGVPHHEDRDMDLEFEADPNALQVCAVLLARLASVDVCRGKCHAAPGDLY